MDTRFKKGEHRNPATEFKPGQHWRPRKEHWGKEWLTHQYVTLRKSALEIATAQGCTENNIYFWLHKHGVPVRHMTDIRAMKHWGLEGPKNPMFGKRGILNHNWRGGLTPARQAIYAKAEWKKLARDVRKRDKCCRLCGSTERTEIHHIDPFSQSPLLVLDIGNVILLCEKCHDKMRGKENRWKRKLFKLIQPERR